MAPSSIENESTGGSQIPLCWTTEELERFVREQFPVISTAPLEVARVNSDQDLVNRRPFIECPNPSYLQKWLRDSTLYIIPEYFEVQNYILYCNFPSAFFFFFLFVYGTVTCCDFHAIDIFFFL